MFRACFVEEGHFETIYRVTTSQNTEKFQQPPSLEIEQQGLQRAEKDTKHAPQELAESTFWISPVAVDLQSDLLPNSSLSHPKPSVAEPSFFSSGTFNSCDPAMMGNRQFNEDNGFGYPVSESTEWPSSSDTFFSQGGAMFSTAPAALSNQHRFF
jgi:hypothetical protein